MWQKVISYKELKISLCQILYVKELNIQESINNHGTLTLTAILTNEMKAEMIHQLDEVINVYYGEGESCVSLFQGRITTISFDTEGELYRLYVTAKSYTYGMDITRKSRSFQDINMLSHTLIKSIMKDYPQSDCLLEIPNEPIGELVIQYEETDWEFIKRFVSRYGAGLFPENGFSGLRYHAGTPRENAKVSWEDRPYEIIKDVAAYRKVQSNSLKDMNPLHYVTYRVGAYDYLSLGTEVTYRGSTLYIYEISRRLEGGQLISYYDLRQKKGLRQTKCYNERITGVSIDGLIIEVKRNQVKVHLEIDNNQDKGKAYWFPYSTVSASEGGSGWYCMPEIGESVRAYFPVHDEKESYVITNIKGHTPEAPQEGDYMSDPTNKNISTAQDKQVLFTPEGVFIVANSGNGQVNLKLDGSVEVSGIDDISINAVKEVKLRGDKEVAISADKKIDILCEAEGHIQILPGGTMLLDAKEIYENPSIGGMVTAGETPATSGGQGGGNNTDNAATSNVDQVIGDIAAVENYLKEKKLKQYNENISHTYNYPAYQIPKKTYNSYDELPLGVRKSFNNEINQEVMRYITLNTNPGDVWNTALYPNAGIVDMGVNGVKTVANMTGKTNFKVDGFDMQLYNEIKEQTGVEFGKETLVLVDKQGKNIDLNHLFAVVQGQENLPGDTLDSLVSWGGDLRSLSEDIKKQAQNEPLTKGDVKSLTREALRREKNTNFGSLDLYADIDAENIAAKLEAGKKSSEGVPMLSDVMAGYYNGESQQRVATFIKNSGGMKKLRATATSAAMDNGVVEYFFDKKFVKSGVLEPDLAEGMVDGFIETLEQMK